MEKGTDDRGLTNVNRRVLSFYVRIDTLHNRNLHSCKSMDEVENIALSINRIQESIFSTQSHQSALYPFPSDPHYNIS